MSLVGEHLTLNRRQGTGLDAVSITLRAGSLHALLGPNGSGKSTLLGLLAGEQTAHAGRVLCDGDRVDQLGAAELARRRAVLTQDEQLRFGFPVREVVRLGRMAWAPEPAASVRDSVARALETVDAGHLADRSYTQLSGGERRRVQLARVLAQLDGGGRYLLLDEPTAHLDLDHGQQLMAAVARIAAAGVGVLVVLHDPNLASRWADEATLLRGGRVLAHGKAGDTLTADKLGAMYGTAIRASRSALGHPLFEADR